MAAGQGLGAGIARHLHAVGYRWCRTTSEPRHSPPNLVASGCTARSPPWKTINRTVQTALDSHGRIDLVVNNTGHAPLGELLSISDDEWHGGLDLILLSVLRMARTVTPSNGTPGWWRHVNISSYSVVQAAFPTASVSQVLRSALAAWTKMYADTYGSIGIRMNNSLPGWFENTAGGRGDSFVPEIPLRRLGLMHELGATIAFLASEGGGYITGQNLRIDGGLVRPI